ncbi:MAG: hypothetical protein IT423_07765 [Pirellulaceae bacterium]|nr:hypothetical protein [Pirellulaceae bacterium]
MNKRYVGFIVILALMAASGCDEKTKLAEVTGVVTLDGKPLELIQVEFWPTTGPRSIGKTDTEGKFTLEIDDRTQKGAIPGTHKVALRDTWPSKDDYINDGGEWVDKSNGKKSRIHSKYYDAPLSPLSVEVVAGKPNTFDFKVDPRK